MVTRKPKNNVEKRFGVEPRFFITPVNGLSQEEREIRGRRIFDIHVSLLEIVLKRKPSEKEIFGHVSIKELGIV